MKRNCFAFLLLIALGILASCKKENIVVSDQTIVEQKYTQEGSQQVSSTIVKDANNKNLYTIYYPSNLSTIYPVIVWGNGTGMKPDKYKTIHQHLASWGFIVIDNYDEGALSGASIIETYNYIVSEHQNAESIFYQHIDTAHIGAAGHSQGASGVINAHTQQPGGSRIKTLVPIALPKQSLLKSYPEKVSASIFVISSTNDGLISPYSTNKDAFDKIPNGVPAAVAMRRKTGHDAIINTRMQFGYLTAWMLYQLKNDAEARKAFADEEAELLLNPNWENAATKNMY